MNWTIEFHVEGNKIDVSATSRFLSLIYFSDFGCHELWFFIWSFLVLFAARLLIRMVNTALLMSKYLRNFVNTMCSPNCFKQCSFKSIAESSILCCGNYLTTPIYNSNLETYSIISILFSFNVNYMEILSIKFAIRLHNSIWSSISSNFAE